MAAQDPYESLLKSHEFMMGRIENREELKRALQATVSAEDLQVYLLIPNNRRLGASELARRARRLRRTQGEVEAALERLYREAFVLRYESPQGPVYERCPLTMLTEQQVRLRKGTSVGRAYADFWLAVAEGAARALPTKTPYFRVLPVESTVTEPATPRTIAVNRRIPDPREVLPLDVVSEMVRRQPVIGVAECYCRLSADLQGNGCGCPKETCFVFNEFAESLIELGIARRLDLPEALRILDECERAGLVHNINNYQERIQGLCNCCACTCPGMKLARLGLQNVEAPSRYRAEHDPVRCVHDGACAQRCPVGAATFRDGQASFDAALCLGCGLCASACPQGAVSMVLRDRAPQVPRTYQELNGRLMREALVGFVWNKIRGR
jgi:Pyruvate/2-oxoacid:ferredoxin oxidoreductase delta subunit/DNA-binding MarR family transcriptional regulator